MHGKSQRIDRLQCHGRMVLNQDCNMGLHNASATDKSHLDWPFFDAAHRELAPCVRDWAQRYLIGDHDESRAGTDAACRELVKVHFL
ncbi:MAG: hypothetical protein ACREXP_23535 [Steroidobacteraceae bacterium]